MPFKVSICIVIFLELNRHTDTLIAFCSSYIIIFLLSKKTDIRAIHYLTLNCAINSGNVQNLPLEVQPSAFSVDTFPSSSLQFQTVEDPNGFCDRVVQPLPEPINDQLLVDATSSNLAITSGTGIVKLQRQHSFFFPLFIFSFSNLRLMQDSKTSQLSHLVKHSPLILKRTSVLVWQDCKRFSILPSRPFIVVALPLSVYLSCCKSQNRIGMNCRWIVILRLGCRYRLLTK